MIDRLFPILTFAAAIGSGLIAGVFFAFSTFVMRALGRQPAPAAVAAMQAINVVVINPWFLGVFMGTAGLCVAGVIGAWLQWDRPGSGWLLAGAMLYLIGTFGVTMFGNVPLNDALAKVSPDVPDIASIWSLYRRSWTMWNHLRTLAATAAMAALMAAFAAGRGS